MQTLIIHPDNKEKLEAVKAVLKALNVLFETKSEKPYNPEFVKKILAGDKDYKAGKGKKITVEELDSLWK